MGDRDERHEGSGAGGKAPLLSLRDIHVDYNDAQILKGASLTVEEGEVHVLIGPNGAGKTTLANVLTGHVRPTSGAVEVRGQPLSGSAWRRARRGVGRKFQVPRVFTRLSTEENLEIADARKRPEGDAALGEGIGVDEVAGTEAKYGQNQVTNQPMVDQYVGVKLWAEAVKKSGSTSFEALRDTIVGTSYADAPEGLAVTVQENRHVTLPSLIGQANDKGQYDIVENFGPRDPDPFPSQIVPKDRIPDCPAPLSETQQG